MKRFSEKYLKDFYGGKIEKEDDGYYFHDEEVFVRVSTYQKISLEEYNVLNRFI